MNSKPAWALPYTVENVTVFSLLGSAPVAQLHCAASTDNSIAALNLSCSVCCASREQRLTRKITFIAKITIR